MSPEQVRGDEVDPRSDVFALGLVLYEMVTGVRAFDAQTSPDLLSAILRDTPTPVEQVRPDLPRHLGRVIRRCLEKDPEHRYQSAKDVRNELSTLEQEVLTGVSGSRPIVEPDPETKSPKLAWYLFSILAVVLVIVGIWVFRPPGEPPTEGPLVGADAQELLDQAVSYELRGFTKENLTEAEDRYRRALEPEPDNPVIQGRLASLLLDLHAIQPDASQLLEARQLAEAALGKSPDSLDALLAMGTLAVSDKDLDVAERAARQVIEQQPDSPFGYTLLGKTLVKAGKLDLGLEQLRQGVTLAGTDTRPRLALAWALWHQGRTIEAAVEYEQVLEYFPDSPSALNNLAIIYGRQGRYLEAIPLLRRLLRTNDDADAAYNLANCYFYLGPDGRGDRDLRAGSRDRSRVPLGVARFG